MTAMAVFDERIEGKLFKSKNYCFQKYSGGCFVVFVITVWHSFCYCTSVMSETSYCLKFIEKV